MNRSLRFVSLCCLFWLAALPAAASDNAPIRIVILGDSLVAGFGLPQEHAYPRVMQAALNAKGYNVELINAGVSGDTANGGLSRLDWSTGGDVQGAMIELGANDMLRGIDPTVTEHALDAILMRLRKRGVAVLLAGMIAAPGLGKDYEERFNDMYKRLADKHKVLLYPFFLDGVAGNRELLQRDGMHPTAKGVNVIVERTLPIFEQFLSRIPRR